MPHAVQSASVTAIALKAKAKPDQKAVQGTTGGTRVPSTAKMICPQVAPDAETSVRTAQMACVNQATAAKVADANDRPIMNV